MKHLIEVESVFIAGKVQFIKEGRDVTEEVRQILHRSEFFALVIEATPKSHHKDEMTLAKEFNESKDEKVGA